MYYCSCKVYQILYHYHIADSVQDCTTSSAKALEILQYCTKPLIWSIILSMKYIMYPPYQCGEPTGRQGAAMVLVEVTLAQATMSLWDTRSQDMPCCAGRRYDHDTTYQAASPNFLNPLHAKFCRGNKQIFTFLHIDMYQVLKILPQVRQGPTYSTYMYSISWLLMSWRRRKEPGHQQPWYWPS